MTKEDKLKELDILLLDKMIHLVRDNKTDELPDLTAAINYVTKNNVVSDKATSTAEEQIAQRIKEANTRRENE